ncbi:MAG TPA: LysR family transcriptional regulator [Burkholderiaceae bacterium]|jgi:DNA-binding transcriptional LysR family regulator
MDQPRFDLNLLRVFRAVYVARNVRRAAEQIGLSQPAVSHGLTRLRLQLKDPLFVRTPGGVEPTARAHHVARSVEAALAIVEATIDETEHFDPLSSERRFVLHMSDLGQGEFLPVLMEHLGTHAPRLRVEATQLPLDAVLPALEQNRIDFALGYLPDVRGTEHERLIADRYVIVARADHPLAATLGTKRTLAQLEFLVSLSHPEPAKALTRLNLAERVRLTLPHYGAAPDVLCRTGLAAIIPRRPALRFAKNYPLVIRELRIDLPPLEIWAHWTWRMNHNPGHRWLRETLAALYR